MCGLAGVAWSAAAEPVGRDTLDRMTDILRHRGPDDRGVWFSPEGGPGIGLGHRRLSIIDLTGGHQPLANEDGSIQVVFNGEIYNYGELAAELQQRGHQFRSVCDTEVLVHLYEELGTDMLRRLRGMFAFALWDQQRRRLLLARDRLGKKPLVYRHAGGRFWFASELKSLFQAADCERKLDPRAIADFVARQYIPQPRTGFVGCSKLPPGHWLEYDATRDTVQIERYWQPGAEPLEDRAGLSSAEWKSRLRETLTDAVRIRLRSDVPLGAFLSGGVDSSIVAGLMRQESSQPVHTYSIGFDVPEYDERAAARAAAERLGTIHHEAVVRPDAAGLLPTLIWHYDEPFADSSAIPTYWLSRFARQDVTVALSGDGGDELFSGYDRYRAMELAARLGAVPLPMRRALAGAARWLPAPRQKSVVRRLERFLKGLPSTPLQRYSDWTSIFDRQQRAELLHPDFVRRLEDYEPDSFLVGLAAESTGGGPAERAALLDLQSYLPGDILTKVDMASMANGLECRSPLLDQEVVRLALAMPQELKRTGRVGKQILRETFAEFLPPAGRAPRKMGFAVPLDAWFRGELRPLLERTLLDERSLGRGLFRAEVVRRLVAEHITGGVDHSARLWLLLVLELWQQMYVDGVPPPTAPALLPLR